MVSSTHKGWLHKTEFGGRLAAVYNGTEVLDFDADDVIIRQNAQAMGTFYVEGVLTLNSNIDIGGTNLGINGVTYTWPAADGGAGTQLQTDGSGALSWAAAGSLKEFKELAGKMDPREALSRLLDANVYRFHYKDDAELTTGDHETEYVGIVGDEAPWAMHHGGRVFNPVNAFGHAVAAIQALTERVQQLEGQLAQQGGAA